MNIAAFITIETGDDLLASFAIPASDDPVDVDSLTILRTPKFESSFDDSERGVKVMSEDDDDEHELLKEFSFDKDALVGRFTTANRVHDVDVSHVDPNELTRMCVILGQGNFDERFKLSGV